MDDPRVAAKFAACIHTPGPLDTACLIWPFGKKTDGYGSVWHRRKRRSAHRVAYEDIHGPIPDGMLCCHKCDNPSCVNTDHLFIGTDRDNARDRHAKGRSGVARGCRNGSITTPGALVRGEEVYNAKLTDMLVVELRERYASGTFTLRELADAYSISRALAGFIVNRQRWKHVH